MESSKPTFVTGKILQASAMVLWLVFVVLLAVGRIDVGAPLLGLSFLLLTVGTFMTDDPAN